MAVTLEVEPNKFYARPGGRHYHIRGCYMLAGGDFERLKYKEITYEEAYKRKLRKCSCIMESTKEG